MQWKRNGYYWVTGRSLFRALALSKILTDPRDRAEALEHMAYELARQGRPDLADEAARRAVACFAARAPEGLIPNLMADPLTAGEGPLQETDPRRLADSLPAGWWRDRALAVLDHLRSPRDRWAVETQHLEPPETRSPFPAEGALYSEDLGNWDFMAGTALELLQHAHAAIVAGDLDGAERILVIALATADETDSTGKGDSYEMIPVAGIVLARLALRAAVRPVAVEFTRCDAGWIDFSVTVDGVRAELHASHLFDPFAAMREWLVHLGAGREGTWRIDEEGQHSELSAVTGPEGWRLRIARTCDWDWAPILDAPVDPSQCARAFIAAARMFIDGGGYDARQWERRTLGQALADTFPGLTDDELCRLSAADLALLCDAVACGHGLGPRGVPMAAFLDWACANLTRPHIGQGAYPFHNPEGKEIPADWDGWDSEARRTFLHSLRRLRINSLDGGSLPDVLSALPAT